MSKMLPMTKSWLKHNRLVKEAVKTGKPFLIQTELCHGYTITDVSAGRVLEVKDAYQQRISTTTDLE